MAVSHESIRAEFERYLRYERQLSDHSIEAYLGDVGDFLSFLEQEKKNLLSLGYEEVMEFVIFLYEKGLTARSVARKISALRVFFLFLLRKKDILFLYLFEHDKAENEPNTNSHLQLLA
ncbi:MAG: site-specific integrase [Brevinematales bacterium]